MLTKMSFCVTNTENKSSPLCSRRLPPEWSHAESNRMSPVWTCFTGHDCNLDYMYCEASERREDEGGDYQIIHLCSSESFLPSGVNEIKVRNLFSISQKI